MSELKFNEYWWVLLERNPNYEKNDERHKELMAGHFKFINQQAILGNMFVAIPMSPSGGQYWFDGQLEEEQVNNLLEDEPSIGTVFVSTVKKAFVPENYILFTMEAKKRIDQTVKAMKNLEND